MADIKKLNGYNIKDATARNPTFTQASTRANLVSGESQNTLFGKLMKWYADLKAVAFSGSYNDLSDVPDNLATYIPKNGTFTTGGTITNGQTYTIPSDGWYLVSMAMIQTIPDSSTDISMGLLVKNGSNEVTIFSHDITGLQQNGFFNMGISYPFKKDTVLKWNGTANYTNCTFYKLT